MALASPAPERQNRRRRRPSTRTHSPGSSAASRRATPARKAWHAMASTLTGLPAGPDPAWPVDDDGEHGDRVAAGQVAQVDAGAEPAEEDDVGGGGRAGTGVAVMGRWSPGDVAARPRCRRPVDCRPAGAAGEAAGESRLRPYWSDGRADRGPGRRRLPHRHPHGRATRASPRATSSGAVAPAWSRPARRARLTSWCARSPSSASAPTTSPRSSSPTSTSTTPAASATSPRPSRTPRSSCTSGAHATWPTPASSWPAPTGSSARTWTGSSATSSPCPQERLVTLGEVGHDRPRRRPPARRLPQPRPRVAPRRTARLADRRPLHR